MKNMILCAVMVMACLAIGFTSNAQTVQMRDPDAWVANFETGHSEILSRQQGDLNTILTKLRGDSNLYLRAKGLVSDLVIQSQTCYVSPDYTIFELRPTPGANPVANTRDPQNPSHSVCQFYLARSRVVNVTNWLVSNGISPNRIQIFMDESVGLRDGGNFPNQAVAAWFEVFPCPNGQCTPCPTCQNGNTVAPPNTTPLTPPATTKDDKFPGCGLWGGIGGGLLGAGLGSLSSSADAGKAHAEVNGNPLLGAAAGALLGAGIDCAIQYAQWKKANR